MESSSYFGDFDDVIIDLDDVAGDLDIPPNASYVLNGLDTMNPVLIIDGSIYLIGTYDETIGECLVLHESDGSPMFHEETGPSEVNLFTGKCIVDSRQISLKQIKPIARLEKILKFRLMTEAEKKEASGSLDWGARHVNNLIFSSGVILLQLTSAGHAGDL